MAKIFKLKIKTSTADKEANITPSYLEALKSDLESIIAKIEQNLQQCQGS